MKRQGLIAFGIFSCLTIFLFFPFFSKFLLPFSGNFLLAWFEPWRTDYWQGAITLPHKPIGDDALRQLYPFKTLAMETLKTGRWPLWNSYNGTGMPLWATMHVGFLNPFNLFFFFFPPYLAWSFLIILQPILLALFFYLYARQISLSFWGALFGGIVLATSGFVISRLVYGEYLYVFMWLPLLLFLIEKFFKGKKWPICVIPFVIFLLIGSGHPQIAIYVLGSVFVYGFFCLRNLKKILLFAASFLGGLGLAAIQLIPTFELWQHSALGKQTSLFIFERFLMPFSHLITLLIPNFFGNPGTYNFWGTVDYIETVMYIGSGAFFFALLGLCFVKKNWRYWYFLLMIFVSLLVSFESPFSHFLARLSLPFLSTSVPTRIFGLSTFALAVLAAGGLDGWLKNKKILNQKIKRLLFFLAFFWLVIIGKVVFSFFKRIPCSGQEIIPCWRVAIRNSFLAFIVFLCTFGLFILKKRWFKKKYILAALILLLTTFFNLYLARRFLPFSPKESFYPDNELILVLKELQKDKKYRFWSVGEGRIKTNLATAFGIYSPEYYDPLYNRRYGEFVSFINSGNPDLFERSDVEIVDEIGDEELNFRRRKGLALLSVKNVLLKKKPLLSSEEPNYQEEFCQKIIWTNNFWRICEQEEILPRFFLIGNYEVIDKKEKIFSRLFDKNFNPRFKVILEEFLGPVGIKEAKQASMQLLNANGGEFEFKIKSDESQLLVVGENYFPGWQAFVDGKKEKVFRANYTFMAVFVPQGEHEVRLIYQPKSFLLGAWISAGFFGLLVFSSLFALGYKRSKKE